MVKIESIKDGKGQKNNKDILPVHYKVEWKIKGEILSKKAIWRWSEAIEKKICRSWSESLENMGEKIKGMPLK